MNTKRWVAVAIACATVVFTLTIPTKTSVDEEMQQLLMSDDLSETVIEEGDFDKKIVSLSLDGTIASTDTSSLFGAEGYNHTFFMEQLRAIQEDASVGGVLLEVNTPGGGVYESAEIAREIKAIQDQKIPVYVAMKSMAASGGYYISASADKIYATPETMTGSIGVIMSGLNYSELLEKLGVEDATVKSGALKDVGSGTRKWTDEDKKVLQTMVDNSYNRFVKIVSEGRDLPEETVRKIADGRIYDGEQALENKLVDQLGYPEEALAALKKEQKLENAAVVSYETSGSGWLSQLPFNIFNGHNQKNTQLSVEQLSTLTTNETSSMMYLYGGE